MLRHKFGLMGIHRGVENAFDPRHVEPAILCIGMVPVHGHCQHRQCRHQSGGERPLRPPTEAACRL